MLISKILHAAILYLSISTICSLFAQVGPPPAGLIPNLPPGYSQRVVGIYIEGCDYFGQVPCWQTGGDSLFKATTITGQVDGDGNVILVKFNPAPAPGAQEIWSVTPDGVKKKLFAVPHVYSCTQLSPTSVLNENTYPAFSSVAYYNSGKGKKNDGYYVMTQRFKQVLVFPQATTCNAIISEPSSATTFITTALIAVEQK